MDFIKNDLIFIPITTLESKEKFRQVRLQVYIIIRNHIKPVLPKLVAYGYTFDKFINKNLYIFYIALKKIILAVLEFNRGKLLREFNSLN